MWLRHFVAELISTFRNTHPCSREQRRNCSNRKRIGMNKSSQHCSSSVIANCKELHRQGNKQHGSAAWARPVVSSSAQQPRQDHPDHHHGDQVSNKVQYATVMPMLHPAAAKDCWPLAKNLECSIWPAAQKTKIQCHHQPRLPLWHSCSILLQQKTACHLQRALICNEV